MSITTTGVVTNGVVVPYSPLPEGAKIEIVSSELVLMDSLVGPLKSEDATLARAY
jgi:hypothetical protein